MIVPRYYENLDVLHENTMSARAYYIPASKRMDDLAERREMSDRIQFLNGVWKFKYYDSIYDVTEEFYRTDFDVSGYDTIKVPGVWQNAGYDCHQYTNIRYPFPFDPPYVPCDIPCGAYAYDFTYSKDEKAGRALLNFEGVDSCFYVWLNGKYVGYSQVPHCTDEFDVTDVIRAGSNRIAVLVLKWCDGSYLEDQDKFRMSGIFRDVYILKRPEQAIRDYRVATKTEMCIRDRDVAAVIHQRIDKRTAVMPRCRMYHHSFWFVHDDQIIIFIQNIKRDILRLDRKFLRLWYLNRYQITHPCFLACFYLFSVYGNTTLFDQRLQIRSR